jgi:hypothetical protein
MGIYHKLDGNILYNFEVNVDKDIDAIRLGYKPLFVDDNGKGVMSVESFKRVFYAFNLKAKKGFTADIKSGSDGDESNYNVVRVSECAISYTDENDINFFDDVHYEEPKKADVKRESSKKTSEKAQAKKAESEKVEAESNKAWNKRACANLIDVFMKYGIRLTNEQLNNLESDIIKVLETTI